MTGYVALVVEIQNMGIIENGIKEVERATEEVGDGVVEVEEGIQEVEEEVPEVDIEVVEEEIEEDSENSANIRSTFFISYILNGKLET